MTASVLQEAFSDDAFGSGNAQTSPALSANATVGSCLEAWVSLTGSTNPDTVIDSAGQTYALKSTVFDSSGGQQMALYVFPNNASATKLTVTASWAVSQTGKSIWVKEIGGVTTAAIDVSAVSFTTTPGTSANAIASSAVTPVGTAPYFCSSLAMENFLGDGHGLAAGTGYTLGSSGWSYGTGNPLAKSEFKQLSSSVSTSATWTDAVNGAGGSYLVGIAIYDVKSSSGISGTLAETLGAATVAATATVAISATLTKTLSAATLAAAGAIAISATLSETLAAATLVAAGTSSSGVSGTLTQTLADASLSAKGLNGSSSAGGGSSQVSRTPTIVEPPPRRATLALTLADCVVEATAISKKHAIGGVKKSLGDCLVDARCMKNWDHRNQDDAECVALFERLMRIG